MGLMQLMPATARQYGVDEPLRSGVEHRGGHQAPEVACSQRLPLALALAAYNAGEGAVQRFSGIPPYPETRSYVSRILAPRRTLAETRNFTQPFARRHGLTDAKESTVHDKFDTM